MKETLHHLLNCRNVNQHPTTVGPSFNIAPCLDEALRDLCHWAMSCKLPVNANVAKGGDGVDGYVMF